MTFSASDAVFPVTTTKQPSQPSAFAKFRANSNLVDVMAALMPSIMKPALRDFQLLVRRRAGHTVD
jgi:hypothetical protein